MTVALTVAASVLSAPAPTATPDALGERYYQLARAAWRAQAEVPYVRYGARVRYEHHFHTFVDWWDAYYRTSDGRLDVTRLHDPEDENKRLSGAPIVVFGLPLGDSNPIAEKIEVDDPVTPPTFSFGLAPKSIGSVPIGAAPAPPPAADDGLREIAVVSTAHRIYDVRYAGTAPLGGVDAIHLTFAALRDPKVNRLRELWLDPTTYRTMEVRVQGLLEGKPFDGASWHATYVEVEHRNYLQRIVADEPLHFGANTLVPSFEFDFFDYRFPQTAPPFTFDGRLLPNFKPE